MDDKKAKAKGICEKYLKMLADDEEILRSYAAQKTFSENASDDKTYELLFRNLRRCVEKELENFDDDKMLISNYKDVEASIEISAPNILKGGKQQSATSERKAQMADLQGQVTRLYSVVRDLKLVHNKTCSYYDAAQHQGPFRFDGCRAAGNNTNAQTDLEIVTTSSKFDYFGERNALLEQYAALLSGVKINLNGLWTDTARWQAEQKQSTVSLTASTPNFLTDLDKLYEEANTILIDLTRLINSTLEMFEGLSNATDDPSKHDIVSIRCDLSKLFKEHLNRILIVCDYMPHRIIRSHCGQTDKFSLSVRLLGGKSFGMDINPAKINISVIHYNNDLPGIARADGLFQIQNDAESTFCIDRTTGSCSAQFHNLVLIRKKRCLSSDSENQKYVFEFNTRLQLFGESLTIKVNSLPVILVHDSNQEVMAIGRLVWDAALPAQARSSDVAAVINKLFIYCTERELTEEELEYLTKRLAECCRSTPGTADAGINNEMITKEQFLQLRLPGLRFSFWKWIWACLNLVCGPVKEHWQQKRIFGFISKEDARQKLINLPVGTFLLRFSEREIAEFNDGYCASLTVAVHELNPSDGHHKVFFVKQYLAPSDIEKHGLPCILAAMEVSVENGKMKRLLNYLFPETKIRFQEVFECEVHLQESPADGYIHTSLQIKIFLNEAESPSNEYKKRLRQSSMNSTVRGNEINREDSSEISSVCLAFVPNDAETEMKTINLSF